MIKKIFELIFWLGALSGLIVILFGFFKSVLIFPKGALHIVRLWFSKDYYSEDERVLAKRSLFMMIVGLLTTLINLILLYLTNKFSLS